MADYKPKFKKKCKTCQNVMVLYPYEKDIRKYCSRDCTKPMYSKLFKNNKNAQGNQPWNKGLTGVPTGRKGPRPHARPWNKIGDGITAASKLEREKFRRTTQLRVFTRDNYTCQMCDQPGGYLQVDHIKSWAKFPELRFDLDNCRTLCMACHYYVTFKRKMPSGTIWGHNLSRRIV